MSIGQHAAVLEIDVRLGLFGLQFPDSPVVGVCCFTLAVKKLSVRPLPVHHDLGLPFAFLLGHTSEPAASPTM